MLPVLPLTFILLETLIVCYTSAGAGPGATAAITSFHTAIGKIHLCILHKILGSATVTSSEPFWHRPVGEVQSRYTHSSVLFLAGLASAVIMLSISMSLVKLASRASSLCDVDKSAAIALIGSSYLLKRR